MQRYDKEKCEELLATDKSSKTYAFDYFFEKSQRERSDFNQLHISDSESDEEVADSLEHVAEKVAECSVESTE